MIESKKDITQLAKQNKLFDETIHFDKLYEKNVHCSIHNDNKLEYEIENVKLLDDFGKFNLNQEFKYVSMIVEPGLYSDIRLDCFLKDKSTITDDNPILLGYPDLQLFFNEGGYLFDSYCARKKSDEEIKEIYKNIEKLILENKELYLFMKYTKY